MIWRGIKTVAAGNGKWQIPSDQPRAGSYFAVVTKLKEGTAGTIYVCKKGKSKVIAID